jgi:hypothetical protein
MIRFVTGGQKQTRRASVRVWTSGNHDPRPPTRDPPLSATCAAYEKLHGVSFGAPEAGLGNARAG